MEKSKSINNLSANDLSIKELLAFSIGYFALFTGGVYFNYLSFYWSDIVFIPLGAIATIMFVSRIFDGVTDIIVGFLVDKTKTKYGKARPWLLWMAIPSALAFIGLFSTPNIGVTGKIIYAFILYNCVTFFFDTASTIPLQALTALMTKDEKKRLNMNMLGQLFGSAAMVLGNLYAVRAIAAFGGGAQGYSRFFGMLGIIIGALLLVTFAGTKEKVVAKNSNSQKIRVGKGFKILFSNKYWIYVTMVQVTSWLFPAFMAINIYYMIWVIGDISLMGPFMSLLFFAMFIAVIVLAPIARKIGKGKTAFLGMILQFVGGLIVLVNPMSRNLLMFSAILRGAGPAAMLMTRLAFTSDVVEYGEWKTGIRTEGLIFSGTSMGQKIGLGLGGAIVALMLNIGGYVGGATSQSASALSAITFTFTWLSAIASFLAIIFLYLLSKLKKEMPQIMKDLEERNS